MAQQSTRTRGTTSGNLGVAPVNFDPNRLAYAILVPRDAIIDAAARAQIRKFIKDKALAPNKADRWQPFPQIVTAEPQGADMVKESSNSGFERIIRESGYAYMFSYWKGGKMYHTTLRSFNGLEDLYDLLLVDADNVLMGAKAVDANGGWAMKGYSLAQLFTDSYKFNDGTKGSEVKTFVSLASSAEFNDNFEFIELDFNFGAEIKGMVDVRLLNVSTGVPGPTITLAAMAGAENLVARFKDVLNVNTAWKAIRLDTGAIVPITTVSATPGVGFPITHNLTGIPSGTTIRTSLDSAGLATLNIKGYESNSYEWQTP